MVFKKSLLAAAVAVCAVGMMAESSHAFFGRHRGHGSCGSSGGSWGGSHGSWGGGSRGSWGGGSWGGGSRGSWGSSGSHGGYYGSYGSGGSWGSSGSHGGYGGVYYGSGYYANEVIVRESAPVVVESTPAVKTRLTLNVPADAKVTLAGVETKQTGETRQFATTRLSEGQVWDDYKVVVELQKDGQTLREERTLTLTGGEPQELTVNFDSKQIAQR